MVDFRHRFNVIDLDLHVNDMNVLDQCELKFKTINL